MPSRRRSGVLLHPTCLPGPFAIGMLGEECRRFLDFLSLAGQSVWQVLPLGPTGYGDSPYSCYSAFAGNPLLICPRELVAAGDLAATDLLPFAGDYPAVDYAAAERSQQSLLRRACDNFFRGGSPQRQRQYADFCRKQAFWLDEYAIFRALRTHFGEMPWSAWPQELRRGRKSAVEHWERQLDETVTLHKYAQFVFFAQWFDIKKYANNKNIQILGDLPIFVAHDSSDVWAHQELFRLDQDGSPEVVAGVPPDYFSATGQRWGNPLYRWDVMQRNDFAWWRERFRWNLQLVDMLRVDHFRGFAACWEIPADEATARNGTWQPVPGHELFSRLQAEFGDLPLIAEDLGVITEDVDQLRQAFGLPGMKILQFAFDSGPDNPYLPHNIEQQTVVYTGTHDNDTTLGWWQKLDAAGKRQVGDYLGHGCHDMPWDLIRVALQSRAGLAMLPLQDLLCLTSTARMNTPGVSGGNWRWRFSADALGSDLRDKLAAMTHRYDRIGSDEI